MRNPFNPNHSIRRWTLSDAHSQTKAPFTTFALQTFMTVFVAGAVSSVITFVIILKYQPKISVEGGIRVEHQSGSRVDISTLGYDSPSIIFRDAQGNVTSDFVSTPTGHSVFTMSNPMTGKISLKIDNATPSGAARIVLYDPSTGKPGRVLMFDSE
ncbi:MAG TPA: hypothetical protein ENJ00_00820 [Phycisphaerales bacterium]|nr:hypothetical protein [Phycisphaerales bacterium]